MHFSLIVACFSLAVYANGIELFFFDDRDDLYNPCTTRSGKFFYPNPTDIHQYYQCDGNGHAFGRSCGDRLVWDDLISTCNWPTAVVPSLTTTLSPFIPIIEWTTTSTLSPLIPIIEWTTTSTLPPLIPIIEWTTTSTLPPPPPTTTQSSSVIGIPVFSLCQPNPCGDHGQCLVTSSSDKFVCVCSGNWFGQLCDQLLGSVVSVGKPPTLGSKHKFPSSEKTDRKLTDLLFGLRSKDKERKIDGRPKRTMDFDFKKKTESESSIEVPIPTTVESTTLITTNF